MKLHNRKLMVTMMFASAAVSGCAFDQTSTGEAGDSAAIIDSRDDLNAYLHRAAPSPIDRLSPPARQRFLDSLVFGEGGLGSYSYADLEAELSVSEIYDILSVFGVERTTSMITGARVISDRDRELLSRQAADEHLYDFTADYEGYECSGRATCSKKIDSICTDNC
jgi:hypothetical protein